MKHYENVRLKIHNEIVDVLFIYLFLFYYFKILFGFIFKEFINCLLAHIIILIFSLHSVFW